MDQQWLEKCVSWAKDLTFSDIPTIVVEEAKNQVISMFSAIFAGYNCIEGKKLYSALGGKANKKPYSQIFEWIETDPIKAAYLISSWSMIHDYDDVMLGGHTGHTSVIVPFILALSSGGSGKDIILAQVVTNEVSARFNIACALGQTRGQMASHLHLIGAALARAKFENLSKDHIEQSLTFSLAYNGKLSLPAFLSSDAKFLCAAWPLRIGWESIDCIRHGLISSKELVTGSAGFFSSNAPYAPPKLIDGFGEKWFTTTNSYKLYPACGYISSCIDCTLDILKNNKIDIKDIISIEVNASMFTVGVDKITKQYLNKGENSISTLSFSPTFIIASTLLYGNFNHNNFSSGNVNADKLWELVSKIEIKHDFKHTNRSLFVGIPTGVVLSNAPLKQTYSFLKGFNRLVFKEENKIRLLFNDIYLLWQWYKSSRESLENLNSLTKPLGCDITISLSNGNILSSEQSIPKGFSDVDVNWSENRELMKNKLYSTTKDLFSLEYSDLLWNLFNRLELATRDDIQRSKLLLN